MIIEERLKRSLSKRRDDVFVRSEFANLGSEAQVNRALRNLLNRGLLVKLGVGVYAKAMKSVLTGKPIPVKPIGVLAPVVFAKLGVAVYPSKATQEYNQGLTTQIPAGTVVNTGDRRIARKIGFGKRRVSYENNKQRPSNLY